MKNAYLIDNSNRTKNLNKSKLHLNKKGFQMLGKYLKLLID